MWIENFFKGKAYFIAAVFLVVMFVLPGCTDPVDFSSPERNNMEDVTDDGSDLIIDEEEKKEDNRSQKKPREDYREEALSEKEESNEEEKREPVKKEEPEKENGEKTIELTDNKEPVILTKDREVNLEYDGAPVNLPSEAVDLEWQESILYYPFLIINERGKVFDIKKEELILEFDDSMKLYTSQYSPEEEKLGVAGEKISQDTSYGTVGFAELEEGELELTNLIEDSLPSQINWSPEGRCLAYHTVSEEDLNPQKIYIDSVEEAENKHVFQGTILAEEIGEEYFQIEEMQWFDNKTLSFTLREEGKEEKEAWQLNIENLELVTFLRKGSKLFNAYTGDTLIEMEDITAALEFESEPLDSLKGPKDLEEIKFASVSPCGSEIVFLLQGLDTETVDFSVSGVYNRNKDEVFIKDILFSGPETKPRWSTNSKYYAYTLSSELEKAAALEINSSDPKESGIRIGLKFKRTDQEREHLGNKELKEKINKKLEKEISTAEKISFHISHWSESALYFVSHHEDGLKIEWLLDAETRKLEPLQIEDSQ